ncbi:hypothetical protein CRI94_16580 [Longibacter salinarum]|uniref:Cell division protein FtsX n=1 Tax=Longibacter salinarum TaxID=1850348 RepID=A0A2A8CTR1_9BACT|nr:ABC transporter permease [Longibacter salinarum]PEN11202.1 hypothetical protein CRI94_16580 [Longibacter salinarum]
MKFSVLHVLLRQLRRRPVYTGINLVGLTVALATCLLIGLYTAEELRYDAFHENSDRIKVLGVENDLLGRMPSMSYPMGEMLREKLPRVEEVVRIRDQSRPMKRPGEKATAPVQVVQAEPSFAEVFSFPVVSGDLKRALTEPKSIALTTAMADRLFGEEKVIGASVHLGDADESGPFTVRAVVDNVPRASSIQFDALRPIPEKGSMKERWGALAYKTFVLLQRPESAESFLPHAIDVLQERKGRWTYIAVDLSSYYLSDLFEADGFRGQWRYLYIFSVASLLMLFLAGINYVNLATLQAQRRAREIAVHKTLGASRGTLARRFLGESVLLALGASLLALALATVVLPAFNQVMSTDLSIRAHWLSIAGFMLSFGVVVGLAAGVYPGVAMARFRPAAVFRRHSQTTSHGGGWLHRGLITLQFAVSVILIASTAVIYTQLDYVQTKNLGFNGEQVAVVSLPENAWKSRDVVRERVAQYESVEHVTLASGVPGSSMFGFSFEPSDLSSQNNRSEDVGQTLFKIGVVDAYYIQTLGMEVIAGRAFDAERRSDRTQTVMLNERSVKEMGWTPSEAVGKPFSLSDRSLKVIGVVRDFHQSSLQEPIKPFILMMHTPWGNVVNGDLAVRLASDDIPGSVEHIRTALADIAPSSEIEVTFLDEKFDAMYRSEQRLSWLFSAFALIAIVIACLGLYGLAAHAVQQRTKEIGIRKALGASLSNVIGLMTREYAVLVGVALVVGTPIAYLLMQRWLEEFAYRASIGAAPFTVTALLALSVGALALGGQAIRAARLDPATTLRDE